MGTASQSNGAVITPTITVGMGLAANDIVVQYAVFYCDPAAGTAPTAITWSSGGPGTFVEGQLAITRNAAGTATGVAGWAWLRATGAFNGTVSITANGTTGASAGAIGNVFKMAGCITGEDPWEQIATPVAPNYTSSVTYPTASMTRSAGGCSIVMVGNTDNVNIATPAGWTALGSNAGTQGLDSAFDSDYRLGAAGSPAGATVSSGNALGWASFHMVFTDTAGAAATSRFPLGRRDYQALTSYPEASSWA